MSNNDMPPVGATVTDADGTEWVMLYHPVLGDQVYPTWRTRGGDGNWDAAAHEEVAPLCYALWREQQARKEAEASAAELEAEVERWRNKEAGCCPEDVGFDEYIGALRAEVARLREGLGAYGQHLYGCEIEQTDFCTCGFRTARANEKAP